MLLALGLACAPTVRAATGAVVVTEFEIPAAESNAWGWACEGLADLLQQSLSALGATVVDREYLHAIGLEQQLSTGGRVDPLRIGALLGAESVASGRVMPVDAETVRLEAWLVSVEQVEKLASASVAGPWRKELTGMLDELAGKLLAGRLPAAPRADQPAGPALRPEALKFLYEGIDACARQQPALAIGCFVNAYSFDQRLEEARRWEVRAYELAGLREHARVLAAFYAESAHGQALDDAARKPAAADARRVIAVLPPFAESAPGSAGPDPIAAVLRRQIEQELLDDERVRVSGYEGLMRAVAEQDAQLSGLMAPSSVARYGRWMLADGLLRSRVEREAGGVFRIDLRMVAPATGHVLARVEEPFASMPPDTRLRRALAKLVGDWVASRSSAANTPEEPVVSPPLTDAELMQLPAHRTLAGAVDKVYVHPAPMASRPALVHAYLAVGERPLAELEFERYATTGIDPAARDAARKALRFYSEHTVHMDMRHMRAAYAILSHVPDTPQVHLIHELIARQPDAMETGYLVFMLLADAWWTARWPTAVRYGNESVSYVDRLDSWRKDWLHRPLIANFYHMYGHALLEVGRYEEARVQLKKAAAFDCDEATKSVQYPRTRLAIDSLGAVVEADWVNQCARQPSIGGMPGLRAAVRDDLARVEAGGVGTAAPPVAASQPAAPPAAPLSTIEEIERLIRVCEDLPAPSAGSTFSPPGEIHTALHRADDTALRPEFSTVLRQLSEVVLRRGGVARERIGAKNFDSDAWWFATLVAEFYEIAARKNPDLIGRSWEVLSPLTGEPYPAQLGYLILTRTPCRLADARPALEHFKRRSPHLPPHEEAAIWDNLGKTEWQRRSVDDAILSFRKARLLNPEADYSPALVEVAVRNRPEDPVGEVARLRGLWFSPPLPQPRLWEWFNAGRTLQATGQWPCAAACFGAALSALPDFDETYGGRGPARGMDGFRKGELGVAIRFYLAECLAKAGRADEAIRLYRGIAAECGDAGCHQALNMVPHAEVGGGYIGGAQIVVKLGVLAAQRAGELHDDDGPPDLPPITRP